MIESPYKYKHTPEETIKIDKESRNVKKYRRVYKSHRKITTDTTMPDLYNEIIESNLKGLKGSKKIAKYKEDRYDKDHLNENYIKHSKTYLYRDTKTLNTTRELNSITYIYTENKKELFSHNISYALFRSVIKLYFILLTKYCINSTTIVNIPIVNINLKFRYNGNHIFNKTYYNNFFTFKSINLHFGRKNSFISNFIVVPRKFFVELAFINIMEKKYKSLIKKF